MSVSQVDKENYPVARSGRSPAGCQTVAGGRSASRDLRCADGAEPILKGSQKAVLQTKGLATLQGAENVFALTVGIAVLLRARRFNPRLPSGTPSACRDASLAFFLFHVSHGAFHVVRFTHDL